MRKLGVLDGVPEIEYDFNTGKVLAPTTVKTEVKSESVASGTGIEAAVKPADKPTRSAKAVSKKRGADEELMTGTEKRARHC